MLQVDPFELFCLYHLGLDRQMRYRFRNLHGVARELGVAPFTVEQWLHDHGLEAAVAKHLPINLAAFHAQAQILTLDSSPDQVRSFARKAWQDYRAALQRYDPKRFTFDIDYDALDDLGGQPPV